MRQTIYLFIFYLICVNLAAAQELSSMALGRKALETVLTSIKSPEADVRGQAASILGQTGNKAATGVLKKLLADSDKHARINAAEALWNLGDNSGIKVLYAIINDIPPQGTVNNSPLEELKIISQNKIREHAIEALARAKRKQAVSVLNELKNDTYGSVRDTAARELARLGYSEELAPFLEAAKDTDEAVRFEGINNLARICNSDAASTLKETLISETSIRIKIAALDAFVCLSNKKTAINELLALADEPNPTIKFKAVSALSHMNEKKAFEKLQTIYGSTNDINLKTAALKGLIAEGVKPDLLLVNQGLSSRDKEVRLGALALVQAVLDDEAKPYLAKALGDKEVDIRLAASLQILKRFSSPRN